MVKPPTLFLLLSYGLFLAAWDAQTATALSLSSLRADLHVSVTEHQSDIETNSSDRDRSNVGSNVAAEKSRFGLRSAAHSIAQSLRAFFQGNPFIQQSSTSVAGLRGISSQQEWETLQSNHNHFWQTADFEKVHHQLQSQSSIATLSTTPPTNLPSFLLTASSALRFQHRLRTV